MLQTIILILSTIISIAVTLFSSTGTYAQIQLNDEKKEHIQRFGIDGASPKWIKTIAEINDGWSGVNDLRWGQIEPAPPENGKHFYKWQKIDEFLNNVQTTKRELQVNIRVFNDWALAYSDTSRGTDDRTGKKTGAIIRIKSEYLSDWAAFITSFVERYDADGYNDMPNLKYPITHIQIECEPENIWENAEGYIEALSTAYKAAKKANPDIQILAAGFNAGDFFNASTKNQQPAFSIVVGNSRIQHKLDFNREFFSKAGKFFDILSLHLSGDYEDIPSTVEWFYEQMLINGYHKPIWSEDTASGQNLSKALPTAKDKEKLQLLKNGDIETTRWYEQEQAKLLVKKAVTAFACGVEKVFISSDVDWPTYPMPIWRHMGLLDAAGNKKPAFYSFKTMAAKLDGFIKVNKLNLPEGIFGYCFMKSTGKVYVLWCEEEKTVDLSDLSLETNSAIVTDIAADAYETLLSQIHVNSRPIFIEKAAASKIDVTEEPPPKPAMTVDTIKKFAKIGHVFMK